MAAGMIVALCLLMLIGSFIAASGNATVASQDTVDTRQLSGGPGGVDNVDHSGITVVATQGFYVGNRPGERDVAELIAYSSNGSVLYRNSTHQVYYDVDPVPNTSATVEYVAADRVGSDRCPWGPRCSRNLIERVNLSTGEVTPVHSAVTPKFDGGRWHDADRVNRTHIVIADIAYDRVITVDTRSGTIVWEWNASEYYSESAGGGQGDWTHINDVEVLDDGRIMASLRNMDSVVFIDPDGGLDGGWTLGVDDDHATLYEPHNPDYLPSERGGPGVLIADSENNRVVEYHRRNGEWRRIWSWRDSRLQWPRDADRLPGGTTLIADSHGDRVIEVGPNGSIVWSVEIGRPYDAERLLTGDESRTGYAAGGTPDCRGSQACGAPPAGDQRPTRDGSGLIRVKDSLPPTLVNSLLFVAPPWVQFTDLVIGGVLALTLLVWGLAEWAWSGISAKRVAARLR